MRQPSRFIPKLGDIEDFSPNKMPIVVAFAVAVSCLVYFLWAEPAPTLGIVGSVVLITVIINVKDRLHYRKLFQGREAENLCTFARDFDVRKIDTWIVRGTFEELQGYGGSKGRLVPIRASDNLFDDLLLDWDDVEDVAFIIAKRAGRSMDDLESNPLFGKVTTVEELVLFMNGQARID